MDSYEKPYRDFNSYLRERFGCRVQKISLDAGLTCPNRDGTLGTGGCIYCNARGSGTGAADRRLSISRQIQDAKSYLSHRYKAKAFLAYFQSFSNTYGPRPLLRSLYEEALSDPDIVGLSVGTRPDCVPEETLDLLQGLSRRRLIWLEYGLQSASDATLERIRRGHTVAAFEDALARTRRRGLPVCVHVILGLPGEERDDMLDTARFLSGRDIQAVKIHLLYVVRGTVLDSWYRSGSYTCMTREQYAETVAQFLALLPPSVIVQRLTGDPHPEELVAPLWALEKQRNLSAVLQYLKDHHLYQGKAFSPISPPV
jgi:uncharacterized protein